MVAIVSPRIFYLALHTGSGTETYYGLHTFSRIVLRQLDKHKSALWREPFRLPATFDTGGFSTGGEFNEKKSSLCFGD
jgi:hypothetical protein